MRQTILLALLLAAATSLNAQKEVKLENWLKAGPVQVHEPVFSDVKNINGATFSDGDLMGHLDVDLKQAPSQGESVKLMGQAFDWQQQGIPSDSVVATGLSGRQMLVMGSYLKTDQWAKLKFTLSTDALFELYIDGEQQKVKKSSGMAKETFTAELHEGNHRIVMKMVTPEEQVKLAGKVSTEKEMEGLTLANSIHPERALNIYDILNGSDIESSSISSSGKYALISYSHSQKGTSRETSHHVIKNLDKMTNVMVLRNPEIGHIQWLPASDRLSYTQKYEGAHNLYLYNPQTGKEQVINRGIKDLHSYEWTPDEEHIIYARQWEAKDPGDLKRIYGNEDRIPGFRDRSYLHLLEVESGHSRQITAGNLSARLHDIRPDSRKILFSTSYPDYTEVPFSKQNLYEMDLQTMETDTIWKDRAYGGRCQYSPDGDQLLVQGAPQTFGDLGVNTADDQLPNSYDGQLYLYDLEANQAEALTQTFAPAVNAAHWKDARTLYLSVTEKEYTRLYRYTLGQETFEKISLQVEVMSDVDFARQQNRALYRGTGTTQPEALYLLNLDKEQSTLIDQPKKEELSEVTFGRTEPWNFTNNQGTTIDGRVYYPPQYDPDQQYPVIVYYYGGTSPTQRTFDGRYPKNIWAGKGYIVYVLQPSGATGYGQQFSALHVNGWGKEAIDDIIEGTRKFLDDHPSADEDRVGAIGASYGGFTTMLLQTRTDLFKTAVSHAGISSITSYWGEGYWGYSYNAGAATHSYPWNNKELYVDNSPLYNADNFNNSILLLHGTADTNVPVGESKQYYAALKILDKDVEMVLVDGENHWIIDYDKRIKWHHTITSWFDMKLKNEPALWQEMYPDKHLR